jgi:hypothetical protein
MKRKKLLPKPTSSATHAKLAAVVAAEDATLGMAGRVEKFSKFFRAAVTQNW